MIRLALLLPLILSLGCNSNARSTPGRGSDNSQAHEHHDHDHPELLGPNKGHLVKLEPPDYSAEWMHDDGARTVTVVILDKEGRQEAAVPLAEVTIETVINDQRTIYKLPARSPTAEDPPRTSHFEVQSADLLTALVVGAGVNVHLEFTLNQTTYKGQIEHHGHAGHHHH